MVDREGVKEIEAAAREVMVDLARADRYLLLFQQGDGSYRVNARLSRDGRVNLRRLLVAIEEADPDQLLDMLG